jgi:hypothetical protein
MFRRDHPHSSAPTTRSESVNRRRGGVAGEEAPLECTLDEAESLEEACDLPRVVVART